MGKVMIAGMGGVLSFRHYYYWSGRYAGAYDRTLWWCESLAKLFQSQVDVTSELSLLTLAAFFLGIPSL